MKPLRIRKEEAILVLIDFQERLMPAMKGSEELEEATVKLVKGCRILGVPILVTQQYTKGLGPTIPSIHDAIGEYEPIEKTAFSAMGEPVFVEKLKESKRKTVILAGIESHVCVLQTALDLIEEGYTVFLVNDCVASRSNSDKKYAQRRIAESGAVGTTYESVLFELLGGARQEGFKDISALVK
ncbi:MAG: hydrolase [Anaerovoracaceae bacterium]|jgi:nicotinamidase-related amidase